MHANMLKLQMKTFVYDLTSVKKSLESDPYPPPDTLKNELSGYKLRRKK